MWTLSPQAKAIKDRHRDKLNGIYKAKGQEPLDDYHLDYVLFRDIPFGHVCSHEFLLRMYGHQWPDEMVIEDSGYTNYWAVRIAKALCKYRRLNLIGCGSSGKSFSVAGYCYTRWKVNALRASVYMSTTSAESGEFRAWGTAKGLHKQDRMKMGKLVDSLRVITLDEETRNDEGDKERDYRNCLKAVLIKSGSDGRNVVGSICGRKNEMVIWNCDELPFMDGGVLDARMNLFSNPFAQFIGCGNGPEEGDPMFIDAEPYGPEFPDGWRSIDKDIHEEWPTKTGHCIYFNGDKSPNLMIPRGKKPPFNRVFSWEIRDEMLAAAGGDEDTPYFWKMVHGLPPAIDIPDKIITHKLLESKGALQIPIWMNTDRKVVAGLDLGFRAGGDPCVIDFTQIGTDENGRKVGCLMGDARPLLPKVSSRESFEKQISVQVIDRCRDNKCHDIALDVTGDGGILLQNIEREAREQSYQLNVLPVSFMGTADDSIRTPGDKRDPTEIYANKMSQIWAQFRIMVSNGVIRGCSVSHKAVKELCGRKFNTDEKRRFLVEPKKEYKKRLRHSPDHADARCLSIFMAIKIGLSGEVKTEAEKAQENRGKWQENMAPAEYSSHGTLNAYTGH